MRRILRWGYIAFLLAALLFGFLFALENDSPVKVVLFGLGLPEGRLGIWLLLFLSIGIVIGFITSVLPSWTQGHRLASLKRRTKELEQEVQLLRSQSLRD